MRPSPALQQRGFGLLLKEEPEPPPVQAVTLLLSGPLKTCTATACVEQCIEGVMASAGQLYIEIRWQANISVLESGSLTLGESPSGVGKTGGYESMPPRVNWRRESTRVPYGRYPSLVRAKT